MTKERQNLGREGEELAGRFLLSRDYKIVAKNFRTSFGEIDLIAYQKNVLVFIEVKMRNSINFGAPEESITLNKKKKISKVASFYLKTKGLNENKIDCRFDVVCITGQRGNSPTIKLIKDAF